jgi:hypothetical protein
MVKEVVMKTKKWLKLIIIACITVSTAGWSIAEEWGTIMYARPNTIIRAKRSMNSAIKGSLRAGQAVKTDFFKDDWYAVFPLKEKERREDKALGYVSSSRLYSQQAESAVIPAKEGKPPEEGTSGSDDEENSSIEVKNITYRLDDDGKEAILIEFGRFYTPAIFTIEGKSARIVLNIVNVSSFRKEWANINVGGKILKRIRCSENPQTHVLRIVLDVEPLRNYQVLPVFNKRNNIYMLGIIENRKKESQ